MDFGCEWTLILKNVSRDSALTHPTYFCPAQHFQVLLFITYSWLSGICSHLTNKQSIGIAMLPIPYESSTAIVLDRKCTFEFMENSWTLRERKRAGEKPE